MAKQTATYHYNKYVNIVAPIIILLLGIISMFEKRFFPLIFIVAALVFLMRILQDIRYKAYKMAVGNVVIMCIFIVGAFLAK